MDLTAARAPKGSDVLMTKAGGVIMAGIGIQ